MEPSLIFQTGVRAALLASPAVVDMLPAVRIRAGSTRPDASPSLIFGASQTEFLGRAGRGQLLARVHLDLHAWALEDGADTARALGAHVLRALLEPPALEDGAELDAYAHPTVAWMRDPDPAQAWTHGIVELEAVVRWRP